MITADQKQKLAVAGGTPVRTEPLPPWPYMDEQDIQAATRVLRSNNINYWTGEVGKTFEQDFAAYCDSQYGIALANGTLALELALHTLDIQAGDEVIVTPRSFYASVSAVAMLGAIPVFADVCLESQNLTTESIKAVLTPKTRAIIVVHLAGWPADMPGIMALAKQHNIAVIEDCAQAQGATINGQKVGSFGDISAYSFCQNKILTTAGEGGAITTNDQTLYKKAWAFKDHGKNLEKIKAKTTRYVHDSLGTNYRLSEVQAAVGLSQLQKLDGWLQTRKQHAAFLNAHLSQVKGLRTTLPGPGIEHAYYTYYVFLELDKLKLNWDQQKVIQAINAEGIPCLSGACPEIYLEKPFEAFSPSSPLPNAQMLGATSLMFWVHPTLSTKDMQDTVTAIKKVMQIAVDE